jgi:hypothetical protein
MLTTRTLGWKLVLSIVAWSLLCSWILPAILVYEHRQLTIKLEDRIAAMEKQFECKDNSCDRYKGADAARDRAEIEAEIEQLRKECRG